MQISLVTSNLNKVREFKAILGNKVKVSHIKMEYRELRSDSPEEIAKESAKRLAEELKIPVVVEDSGLFIKALSGFPGTCSSYVHKRIGLNGILKLMEGIEDRTCFYKSAVAYCEPGKSPISFFGDEKGSVAKEARGNYGFGHDSIFIPENTRTTSGINSVGSKKTYGELENCEDLKSFRKIAVEKLKDYLLKIKN